MKLFFPFSGDDVFISYSRRDENEVGENYAVNLYNELKKRGFSSFLDRLGTEPSPTQPESLNQKIRNSKMLIIVGTERACQSAFVEEEIKEFLKARRIPIVPIDFNGTVPQARWFPLIEGVTLELEPPETLKTGIPSNDVIVRIEEAFKYTKRNDQLRKATYGTFAILVALLLAVGIATVYAGMKIKEATVATTDANNAKIEANTALESANRANEAANVATNKADSETKRATEQANIANTKTEEAKKASKLAEEKDKLAQEKTNLANEKTKIAEAETKRANEEKQNADKQTIIAEAKRKEADEQSERSRQLIYAEEVKTANTLYAKGDFSRFYNLLGQTDNDLKGIEWFYLNHLTEGVTYFNLKNPNQPQTIENIAFSPKGTYLTAKDKLSSGENTDSQNQNIKQNRILVWNTENGERTVFLPEKGDFSDYSFSPDEKLFAVCDRKELKIWDTTTAPWAEIQIKGIEKLNTKITGSDSKVIEEYKNVFFKKNNLILTTSKIENHLVIKKLNIQLGKLVEEKSITNKFPGKDIEVMEITSRGYLLIRYKLSSTNAGQENYQYSLIDDELEKEFKLGSASSESRFYFSPVNDQIAFHDYESQRIQLINSYLDPSTKLELKDSVSEINWRDIAFSPNGKLIAALDETEIRIWDTVTTELITKFTRPYNSYGESIAFSFDSLKIAIGGTFMDDPEVQENPQVDRVLLVWNINHNEDIFTFKDESLISLSTDGAEALTLDKKSASLNLWNMVAHREPIKKIKLDNQKYSLGDVIFSPDNLHFVIPQIDNNDKTISLNLRDTENKNLELSSIKNCKIIGKPSFSFDSQKIFDICDDGSLITWKVEDGQEIKKQIEVKENTKKIIKENLDIDVTPKYTNLRLLQKADKLIVEISDNEDLVWDISTGKQLTYCSEQIIKVSPDGEQLITQNTNESMKYFLRNANDSKCNIKPLVLGEMAKNESINLGGFAFSNDGKYLATYYNLYLSAEHSSKFNEYFIVDVLTKKVIHRAKVQLTGNDAENINVGTIEFSPRGNWVRFGDMYWNNKLKRNFITKDCADDPVFLPDDSRFVTNCGNGDIKFWSPFSGQEVLRLNTGDSELNEIKVLNDGKYLLTGGSRLRLRRMRF